MLLLRRDRTSRDDVPEVAGARREQKKGVEAMIAMCAKTERITCREVVTGQEDLDAETDEEIIEVSYWVGEVPGLDRIRIANDEEHAGFAGECEWTPTLAGIISKAIDNLRTWAGSRKGRSEIEATREKVLAEIDRICSPPKRRRKK